MCAVRLARLTFLAIAGGPGGLCCEGGGKEMRVGGGEGAVAGGAIEGAAGRREDSSCVGPVQEEVERKGDECCGFT